MLIFKSAIVPYLAYAAMKEWKYTHFQMQLTAPLLSVQVLHHILPELAIRIQFGFWQNYLWKHLKLQIPLYRLIVIGVNIGYKLKSLRLSLLTVGRRRKSIGQIQRIIYYSEKEFLNLDSHGKLLKDPLTRHMESSLCYRKEPDSFLYPRVQWDWHAFSFFLTTERGIWFSGMHCLHLTEWLTLEKWQWDEGGWLVLSSQCSTSQFSA